METQGLFRLSTIKLLLIGIRPLNIAIIICSIICTAIKLETKDSYQIVLAILIVALIATIGNLINDIYDIEIDKINKPNRALAKNPNLKVVFIYLIIFCTVTIAALFFTINIESQIIVIITLPLMFLYSFFLKGVPLLGNIFVAFYLAFVFCFTEILITGQLDLMILPSCFAFGISLIREIVKDAEDIKGDSYANLKTVPVLIGLNLSVYFISVTIIGFIVFCSTTFFNNSLFYYEMSMIFLVFMPLFYLIFFLIKKPSREALKQASLLLKKITIVGLLIIYMV